MKYTIWFILLICILGCTQTTPNTKAKEAVETPKDIPKEAQKYIDLGDYCLERVRDSQLYLMQALEHYQKANEIYPGYQTLLEKMGIAAYLLGNYKESIGYLEQSKDRLTSLYYLGLAHQASGEHKTAITYLENVIERDAKMVDVHLDLVVSYEQLREQQKATASYQVIVKKHPRWEYYFQLTLLAEQQENWELMTKAWEDVINNVKDYPADAHFNLARAYIRQKKYEEAQKQLDLYTQKDPNGRTAATVLAEEIATTE